MSDGPRSVWEWLATQDGHAFAYSVIVLLQTLSAYLGWRLRRGQQELQRQLNGHLERHTALAGSIEQSVTNAIRKPNGDAPPLDTTP